MQDGASDSEPVSAHRIPSLPVADAWFRSTRLSDSLTVLIEPHVHELEQANMDPNDYRLRGAPATGLLEDGDRVDLGDVSLTVLHLPGHSPGGIGLLDEATGVLFAADAIYGAPLIYEGPGMNVQDYIETFHRLRTLDVSWVHGGHEPSFDATRMHAIIDHYLASWEADGAA